MGQRTGQLLTTLRAWCEQQRGRQSEVARILGVQPSAVADWFSGRRKLTGEQSLKVQEFLRTAYGTALEESAAAPVDPLQAFHDSLENRATTTIWVKSVGDFYHVILGGPVKDKVLARIKAFLETDKLLAQIRKERK
jgi:transcriptional regulator with XRE-family HTH domain